MDNIIFSNFHIRDGFIDFYFHEIEGDKGYIFFELSPAVRPSTDLIALAISTLCGKKYDNIHFELSLSPNIISEISTFSGSNVTSEGVTESLFERKNGKGIVLNFSGGFDSLAAKCLMPKDTRLVSMDFGGIFSREPVFFQKFNPCIVRTNLVETSLRKNSWQFMGIASILFSEYLDTGLQAFGNILEASTSNFFKKPPAAQNISFPVFKAAGIENAPYVLGLTEIGTLIVLGHYYPELIAGSLDSLANPGEEKRYRKQVLSTTVSNKMGMDIKLNKVAPPKKPYFKFGERFAPDFLIFYVIKYAGVEVASQMIGEIPEEVVNCSKKLSLEFFERYNPNFLVNFPKALVGELLEKLANASVIPYTEKDWDEFNEVKNILGKHYEMK